MSPALSAASTEPAATGSWRARGAVFAAFLLVYGWLQYSNCVAKSATFDEPLHLTAGYLALHQGDYRLDPTHPPLLRMWAALPLLGQPMPKVDTTGGGKMSIDEWTNGSYVAARQFVFGGGNGDRLLTRARLMIGCFGVLLGLLVFCWAEEWLGFRPAAMALGLYTIEPNLMAHSGLVTTDAGVVCLMFGAVYFLWRLQRRWTPWNLAGLAAFTALAVVSKFSALLLGPILLLLLAAAVVFPSALNLRRALLTIALLGAASVFTIWAVYGFRFAPGAAGGGLMNLTASAGVQQRIPLLADLLGWIDAHHLLPNAFTQGFAWSVTSAQALGGYLHGEISTEGWWYYFPVAFLVKTPATLLVLFLAGLVFVFRPANRSRWVDRAFVLVPPAIFLVIAMASRINIGLRHILPLYPHVLLIAAVPIREFLLMNRLIGRLTVALVAVVSVRLFAWAWPSTIAHFNVFVGGPRNGYLYLSDSNLDWGQDLKRLNQWMRRTGVERINLAYFGTVDPASYGIYCVYLPGCPPVARTRPPELPGYVAISATILTSRYQLLYGGFLRQAPVAIIGNTIRIYRVEKWPEPEAEPPDELNAAWHLGIADQLLHETRWYDRAAVHYRSYLQARPNDSSAWFQLGLSLLESGDMPGTVEAFTQAVEFDPAPAKLNLRIAELLLKAHRPEAAEPFARAAASQLPGDRKARDLLNRLAIPHR